MVQFDVGAEIPPIVVTTIVFCSIQKKFSHIFATGHKYFLHVEGIILSVI